MVTSLRRTVTTTAFSDGWPSHHATLHRRWLTEKCRSIHVQCGICPPLRTRFSPKKFQSLNVFFFFLKAFLKIRMRKGVMTMIFGDEKQIRLLVLESSGKQNGLSPPLSFFFLLPFIVSTLYFQKLKIHLLSVLVCAPHYPFLFAPTLLPRWNSGMTTKTKSCRGGHAGSALCGRCLSSIPEMYVSPFTILFCFFVLFLGLQIYLK